jgi:sugar/nucleoside kinase (ribokinase family)
MNYWIEGSRKELLELLEHVDILLVNDGEARQLSGEFNLLRAARWIQRHGPDYVVVKKGEHGAILFARDWMFFAPGYPLEEVFDPTGAGDAFAGGFVGYLSTAAGVDREELRRAIIYGSATGSYAVERFSVDRFRDLRTSEVARRVEEFRELTFFEHELERARDV